MKYNMTEANLAALQALSRIEGYIRAKHEEDNSMVDKSIQELMSYLLSIGELDD